MIVKGGRVPSGWVEVTIGEIGSIKLGRSRSSDKLTGRFPTKYLRAANITPDGLDLREIMEMDFTPEEREAYTLRVGDIMLADSSGSPAHVGRAALWNDEIPGCCYQNHVIRFRPHAVYSHFALLVFRHYAAAGIFARVARGIGILHLGASRFARLPFLLPPWEEQVRIVVEAERRLVELQAAERSLQSALVKIREQRLAILAAAVSGQMVEPEANTTSRQDPEASSTELPSASMRDSTHQDSNLLETESELICGPSQMRAPFSPGWTSVRVDSVGELKLGRQRSPDKQTGRFFNKYLRAANITMKGLDLRDVYEMDFSLDERKVFALRAGDIVLAEASGSAAQVGRAALWRDEIPGCCFQNTVIRFRPRAASPEYALLVFQHLAAVGAFAKVARGAGIQHLGLSRFAAMQFPLPPMAEQLRIADEARRRLDASDAQDEAVRSSLERLPLLEAQLLATAASGGIVPQDPTDESASNLLMRLGTVPPTWPKGGETATPSKGSKVTVAKRNDSQLPSVAPSLGDLIREAGRPLNLPELYFLAGYDRDSIEHIEQFYLALRRQIGTSIHVVDSERENALVEVISDASR